MSGWRRKRPMSYRPARVSDRLLARAGRKRVARRERNQRWLAAGGVLPR